MGNEQHKDSYFLQCEDHRLMAEGLTQVYDNGGLLDQAKKAATIGGGALAALFKQLLSQFGPMIGPILISLLGSLLHLPTPAPTPATPPA